MLIQSHIVTNIPIFKGSDSLKKVIRFFKGNAYSHVAVTEGTHFLGLLSVQDLESFESDKKVASLRYQFETFFVREESMWLDVFEAFARNECNILPVLDKNDLFKGYYDLSEVIDDFIDTPFFTEPGSIVVVEKGIKDYSFSEIAQIVESNNVKLLGVFITEIRTDAVQITLKVSAANYNEVLQSFRRYKYTIIFGNNDDQFLEDLKQRSAYLDKYLNV
ncbi:CBS domain-containing protein [Arenibacter sp. GZD96]|uniref:CBS domain-containing protein n=1 Tax=Aurantibrevibacter litoralis TaxID=3106030 RepID=UPI002AFFF051|nr:CBS domain-containing protein [Arenibacter sp. GZD-96]MEA1784708.1 CBS domain-containing protein [Arenibacter sp. GZD-96]